MISLLKKIIRLGQYGFSYYPCIGFRLEIQHVCSVKIQIKVIINLFVILEIFSIQNLA